MFTHCAASATIAQLSEELGKTERFAWICLENRSKCLQNQCAEVLCWCMIWCWLVHAGKAEEIPLCTYNPSLLTKGSLLQGVQSCFRPLLRLSMNESRLKKQWAWIPLSLISTEPPSCVWAATTCSLEAQSSTRSARACALPNKLQSMLARCPPQGYKSKSHRCIENDSMSD